MKLRYSEGGIFHSSAVQRHLPALHQSPRRESFHSPLAPPPPWWRPNWQIIIIIIDIMGPSEADDEMLELVQLKLGPTAA